MQIACCKWHGQPVQFQMDHFNMILLSLHPQLPEGLSLRTVPTLPATQVHSAQTIHVFSLALCQPTTSSTAPQTRRNLQLLARCVLQQVRRDQRHLSRRRRVSDILTHFWIPILCLVLYLAKCRLEFLAVVNFVCTLSHSLPLGAYNPF